MTSVNDNTRRPGAIDFEGLDYLYRQVDGIESAVRARIDPSAQAFSLGNDPMMGGVPLGFVTRCFHWDATSACNFVRTIGWIRKQSDLTAPDPRAYVRAVMPEAHRWRNKVAAPFARHRPAELEASVLASIGFDDDTF